MHFRNDHNVAVRRSHAARRSQRRASAKPAYRDYADCGHGPRYASNVSSAIFVLLNSAARASAFAPPRGRPPVATNECPPRRTSRMETRKRVSGYAWRHGSLKRNRLRGVRASLPLRNAAVGYGLVRTGFLPAGTDRRTSEWNEPAHGRLSSIAMQMQRGAVTPTLGRRSHRSGAAVFDGIVAWHTRSGRIAGMRFRPQRR